MATIVVTYRRREVLTATLAALGAQSVAPDHIVVVDNDADPGLADELADHQPPVTYLATTENIGYGAALAVGMRHARAEWDPDWYWLLDDDTPPPPGELAASLALCRDPRRPWAVANRGGQLERGRVKHGFDDDRPVHVADFTLVDGTLVARAAVEAVGYPREDLFMMFEDIEYTTRMVDAGGLLLVRPGGETALRLGDDDSWRSYYQARNHLRIAIERRSLSWAWGWAYRMAALTAMDLKGGRWATLKLRWWGAFDGLRGRMGYAIQPRLERYRAGKRQG